MSEIVIEARVLTREKEAYKYEMNIRSQDLGLQCAHCY